MLALAAGVTTIASDFLTEGVDSGRTGWVRDEKIFTTANVGRHDAPVEGEAREHTACDAQPVRAAGGRSASRRRRALARSPSSPGVTDDLFGIDVAAGQQIWHRRFDSTLAEPGGTNDTLCPGGQTAGADDGADIARQVHGVCGVVGWPASTGEPRGRPDVAAPRRSFQAAANRTRSTCTTASSTRRRRRAAAASRMRSTRSTSPRAARSAFVPAGGGSVGTPRRGNRSRRPGVSRHRRRACSIR